MRLIQFFRAPVSLYVFPNRSIVTIDWINFRVFPRLLSQRHTRRMFSSHHKELNHGTNH
ncbi:hypothetical protein ACO3_590186 [Thiomonas arsenitoxydans]|nr:hypothetical protein ACO3_590186 [Thiomonas arsenitoxydans]